MADISHRTHGTFDLVFILEIFIFMWNHSRPLSLMWDFFYYYGDVSSAVKIVYSLYAPCSLRLCSLLPSPLLPAPKNLSHPTARDALWHSSYIYQPHASNRILIIVVIHTKWKSLIPACFWAVYNYYLIAHMLTKWHILIYTFAFV